MKQVPLECDLYNYSVGDNVAPTEDKYKQLLHVVMTDKNYSVGKEKVLCFLAGVNHNPAKHDYDGTKLVKGEARQIEVKPTTYWGKTKLNMKCAFADYTEARFAEDRKVNPIMVVGGFDLHRLLYAVSFDFNSPPFLAAMAEAMHRDTEAARDTPGRRLIPNPNIRAIEQIKDVELLYPGKSNRAVLDEHRYAMTNSVYDFINKLLD